MTIKFDGQGTLVTVSFYMKEADHPWDAGVTIRRTRAGGPGTGSKVDERWLPVERVDAVALMKHMGERVNAVWATGERTATIVAGA